MNSTSNDKIPEPSGEEARAVMKTENQIWDYIDGLKETRDMYQKNVKDGTMTEGIDYPKTIAVLQARIDSLLWVLGASKDARTGEYQ